MRGERVGVGVVCAVSLWAWGCWEREGVGECRRVCGEREHGGVV